MLSDQEQQAIAAGLRSADAFTMRRCQILLASSQGRRPAEIAGNLGCSLQLVRNVINAFHSQGLDCLRPKSRRPKTVQPIFDPQRAEQLRAILHQSPRTFGKPTSVWTLALAAEVCLQQGVTERLVSIERIRVTLQRLGVGWQRAKDWITSPDPAYTRKKRDETD
jgi:transposase